MFGTWFFHSQQGFAEILDLVALPCSCKDCWCGRDFAVASVYRVDFVCESRSSVLLHIAVSKYVTAQLIDNFIKG